MYINLVSNFWQQTVVNESNGNAVTYDINLQGQGQLLAEFAIEVYKGGTVSGGVSFTKRR